MQEFNELPENKDTPLAGPKMLAWAIGLLPVGAGFWYAVAKGIAWLVK